MGNLTLDLILRKLLTSMSSIFPFSLRAAIFFYPIPANNEWISVNRFSIERKSTVNRLHCTSNRWILSSVAKQKDGET